MVQVHVKFISQHTHRAPMKVMQFATEAALPVCFVEPLTAQKA